MTVAPLMMPSLYVLAATLPRHTILQTLSESWHHCHLLDSTTSSHTHVAKPNSIRHQPVLCSKSLSSVQEHLPAKTCNPRDFQSLSNDQPLSKSINGLQILNRRMVIPGLCSCKSPADQLRFSSSELSNLSMSTSISSSSFAISIRICVLRCKWHRCHENNYGTIETSRSYSKQPLRDTPFGRWRILIREY